MLYKSITMLIELRTHKQELIFLVFLIQVIKQIIKLFQESCNLIFVFFNRQNCTDPAIYQCGRKIQIQQDRNLRTQWITTFSAIFKKLTKKLCKQNFKLVCLSLTNHSSSKFCLTYKKNTTKKNKTLLYNLIV